MRTLFVIFVLLALIVMFLFSGPVFSHFAIEIGALTMIVVAARHLLRG